MEEQFSNFKNTILFIKKTVDATTLVTTWVAPAPFELRVERC